MQALSPWGRELYDYLGSNPQTSSSGIYPLDLDVTAKGSGLARPLLEVVLEEVARVHRLFKHRRPLVKFDGATVWIVGQWKHAINRSANHMRRVGYEFTRAPSLPYWPEFFELYPEVLDHCRTSKRYGGRDAFFRLSKKVIERGHQLESAEPWEAPISEGLIRAYRQESQEDTAPPSEPDKGLSQKLAEAIVAALPKSLKIVVNQQALISPYLQERHKERIVPTVDDKGLPGTPEDPPLSRPRVKSPNKPEQEGLTSPYPPKAQQLTEPLTPCVQSNTISPSTHKERKKWVGGGAPPHPTPPTEVNTNSGGGEPNREDSLPPPVKGDPLDSPPPDSARESSPSAPTAVLEKPLEPAKEAQETIGVRITRKVRDQRQALLDWDPQEIDNLVALRKHLAPLVAARIDRTISQEELELKQGEIQDRMRTLEEALDES